MQSLPSTSDLLPSGGPVPVLTSETKPEVHPEPSIQERLVQSRLGVFTGLFYALRAKHPPTAAHALRVAIGCSKWASWKQLDESEREILEVAALLHDVGKIGVPDRVIQKPSQLDGQEQLMMDMQSGVADELLRGAGASEELLKVVRHSRAEFSPEVPPAARMLAIVDAFDSMTTEQVFRRAKSRDRAVEELFAHAGRQFDPELVADFARLVSEPRPDVESAMATRWLTELDVNRTPGFGVSSSVPVSSGALQAMVDTVFHNRLLDSLKDAAIYLDADGQILRWNQAAELISGRQATSLINRKWSPQLLGLHAENGAPLQACPLNQLWETHAAVHSKLRVRHLEGREIVVSFSALPVFAAKQQVQGAIVVVRDASNEADLERKVQSLHQMASQDPLTKVANRVELDSRLPSFIEEHLGEGRRGSLIICDIDYFKRINDTHGHQAGDEALVTFAALLKENSREGDLVARFGGEEFVILCEDCDNPLASARAEKFRRAVEGTPVPALKGQSMTASFGVTELQPGDCIETLVARADRALLMAKSNGRNQVVQLGAGQAEEIAKPPQASAEKPATKLSWMNWFRGAGEQLTSAQYLASVPKEIAVTKLTGFINDHKAELVSIQDTRVAIRIDGQKNEAIRRSGERAAVMLMDVTIEKVDFKMKGRMQQTYQSRTRFTVSIRAVRARDRRSTVLQGQASQLLQSFQAYMVAQEIDDELRQLIIEPR